MNSSIPDDPFHSDLIAAINQVCDRYGQNPLNFDFKYVEKDREFPFTGMITLLWVNPRPIFPRCNWSN